MTATYCTVTVSVAFASLPVPGTRSVVWSWLGRAPVFTRTLGRSWMSFAFCTVILTGPGSFGLTVSEGAAAGGGSGPNWLPPHPASPSPSATAARAKAAGRAAAAGRRTIANSHTRDQLVDPVVHRPEGVLAQHRPLRLVVQLEVDPVDGEVASLLLGPADELAAEAGSRRLRRDGLRLEDLQ